MSEIPVVSFAPFLSGSRDDQAKVAQQVYDAFSTVGFLYLKDHGIPRRSVDRIFEESQRFFAQSTTDKLKYRLVDAEINQGYTADGAEGLNDHKECYEHRRFNNPLCPTESDLPSFRTNVDAFYDQCLTLALHVLRCLAITMNLGDDFFDKITNHCDPQLRLLHYPAIARSEIEKPGHSRIGAHSDFGLCTLLFQDNVGGLEIDPFRMGEFTSAPPIEGTILVNIGDLMQRYTNDRVKSTMHRVKSPRKVGEDGMLPDRYSIPFFVHPDPDVLIDPITLSPGEAKRYKPVIAKEWRDYNTRRNYGLGREKTSLGRAENEIEVT